MSANSKIEWTDHTFNPWEGCQKAGPGCDNCYAETRNKRFGGGVAVNWGPGAPRRRTSVANWRKPIEWNKAHEAFFAEHGRRQRVFCASLGDVFDNAVDPQWRIDLWDLIDVTPYLDWLLLTKRVGNVRDMVPLRWLQPGGWPKKVRLGVTITSQPEADRDITKLLALQCPNFLSMEPLLGPVDLTDIPVGGGHGHHEFDPIITGNALRRADPSAPHVDWVIVGGESGPGARPMHPDWARSLRDQCATAGVPFLFKQWGEWTEVDTGMPQPLVAKFGDPEFYDAALEHDGFLSHGGHFVTNPDWMEDDVPYRGLVRAGKKVAGRLLDGVQHDGYPA